MDCLLLEQETTFSNAVLLTHTDKIHALQTALGNHRHTSDIFLPDDSFYGSINGSDDIERMASTIFKWLGIKHKSLIFHIDPTQDEPLIFKKSHGHSQASLGWKSLDDPLYCGAMIAHAIVHHLLAGRHKLIMQNYDDNETLTDLGTIYAGLGIVVLNGLESQRNPLGSLAENNYISEFIDYVNSQQIVASVWQPYVLPSVIESFIELEAVHNRPRFIAKLQARRRTLKRKYAATAGLTIVVALCVVTYTAVQPRYSSFELAEHRDSINVLKTQYEHCIKTVEYKQSHWDTSDIFMQRQIESDKTRCSSLKNRYNHELSVYETKTQP